LAAKCDPSVADFTKSLRRQSGRFYYQKKVGNNHGRQPVQHIVAQGDRRAYRVNQILEIAHQIIGVSDEACISAATPGNFCQPKNDQCTRLAPLRLLEKGSNQYKVLFSSYQQSACFVASDALTHSYNRTCALRELPRWTPLAITLIVSIVSWRNRAAILSLPGSLLRRATKSLSFQPKCLHGGLHGPSHGTWRRHIQRVVCAASPFHKFHAQSCQPQNALCIALTPLLAPRVLWLAREVL
jgi:hypothetical protein